MGRIRNAGGWGLTVIALAVGTPAGAGQTNGYGPIVGVNGTNNGAVLFSTTMPAGSRTAIPTCGQANPARWALDASTTAGQAQVAVLLTAWAAHKSVYVMGTGTCTIWGDTETVSFFAVQD